jgi:hypothetical protein
MNNKKQHSFKKNALKKGKKNFEDIGESTVPLTKIIIGAKKQFFLTSHSCRAAI